MRKLLLATAAITGATSGLAMAQTPSPNWHPNQGQISVPYAVGPAANNNNNSWGAANTPSGSAAAGGLSTMYAPNTNVVPTPGTIAIRLNARVEADAVANFTTADTYKQSAVAVANSNYNGVSTPALYYKVNPLGVASFFRLYPGFDGMAANGLRYGASAELRENFGSAAYPGQLNGAAAPSSAATSGSQGSNKAGNPYGPNSAVTLSPYATPTSPSANTSAETMFVRRAFTYLASDQVGIVRIGQGDGVLGLFDNGIFTSQLWDAGSGNLNGGDIQSTSVQGPLGIPFVWLSQAGAEYSNNKIVYLSPQFYGIDVGLQYAPSMGNALQASGVGVGCTVAGPTCINVTSGLDPQRWYNQGVFGARYQHTFDAVDVKAYGMYEVASKESVPGLVNGASLNPSLATGTIRTSTTYAPQFIKYDNLGFYSAGLAVTAYNFTLAFDYLGGDIGTSGQLAMKPTGAPNANAELTGLTYANGPIILGASLGVIDGQGAQGLTGISQRHEVEVAFGGNYKLAPGLQLVAEYMYEQRHQGGFNFNTNTIGTTGNSRANSFLLSTVVSW